MYTSFPSFSPWCIYGNVRYVHEYTVQYAVPIGKHAFVLFLYRYKLHVKCFIKNPTIGKSTKIICAATFVPNSYKK